MVVWRFGVLVNVWKGSRGKRGKKIEGKNERRKV